VKVFVIPTWHPTERRPLWANWVLPHIDLIREAGHEAYVLQLGLDDEPIAKNSNRWHQEPRFLNDRHIHVPVPRGKRYEHNRFLYGRFLKKYVLRSRSLLNMAIDRWGKPDILHAHVSLLAGYVASVLGKEYGIPVIVQEHFSGFELDARFWWGKRCYVREMGKRIQGFYAVSPAFAERVAHTNLVNVSGVLPNPIDTALFQTRGDRVASDAFRIVTAGDIGFLKGSDLLFEALRRLIPALNWQLTLFGDTAKIAAYSRWLDDPQFARRVTFRGVVPQEDLRKAYSESDLYVVSSRSETANVSMLQAMSCGVPVVTTACGGPETLIDDTVGVIVRPNDPQALADGIIKVANNGSHYDPVLLREFVQRRYSKPAVAKMVLKVYDAVHLNL
jgi:glycosyltransferase involved in cell wall biosynthesis